MEVVICLSYNKKVHNFIVIMTAMLIAGGSGRNRRAGAGRRRVRNTENNLPSSSTNWREEIMESKRQHNDR